jgi:hypothetical protein
VSRLLREALSFSKKLANHMGAIKLLICHYNLTKVPALHGQHYRFIELPQQSNTLLLRAEVCRRACVAFGTRQQAADGFGPAICSDDPRPVAPWWIMPDMLVVAALELSYPVLLIVLMEADNAALHGCSLVA